MFGIQNYASFIAAILVFQLVPGPGTLTILGATARNGVGAGLVTVAGTLIGDFAYMVAAALGLAALLHAYPIAFGALQWAGIAYLCWLGLRLIWTPASSGDEVRASRPGHWHHFRQGCAVSLTNPKVILFFMAFFPLFLHVDASPVTLGVLIAHVTIISFLYQACLVFVGNALARKLSALPAVRSFATRLAGVALIGFGIRLAIGNA